MSQHRIRPAILPPARDGRGLCSAKTPPGRNVTMLRRRQNVPDGVFAEHRGPAEIELGAVFAISFWPIVVLRGHRTPDSGVASSQWNPTLPVPNRKMDASLSATVSLSLLFIELWHFGVDMPAQPVLVPTKLSQRTRAVSTMLVRPRPLVACRRREVSRKSIHLGDVPEPS